MDKLRIFIILLLLALSFCVFQIGGIFAVIGLYASGYSFYKLLVQEERWIPIGELALSIAAFQWIISPLISYTIPNPMFKMSQDCSTYMMYTVPLYCCFLAGYEKFKKPFLYSVEDLQEACESKGNLAKLFILIGVLFALTPTLPIIAQICKYISQLLYVGFIMLMIAKPHRSNIYLAIPILITLFLSLRGGMFHELLTWSLFLMMIWFKTKQITIGPKIGIIIICLFSVNTLQTVKYAYRQATWYNGSGTNVGLFVDLMLNNASINHTKDDKVGDNNSRYNQGWIISKIYNHVPNEHDYFYGRTYKDAVIATMLPRFLAPNKKGSGQQVQSDFREMTGYPLNDRTSMGLSILGESYGNFGLLGGALFMFFWGWFIARVMSWANDWAYKKSFLWILLLPIIGFVLIEAEISMITVLNWTIKGLIFSYLVVYICQRRDIV